MLVKANNGLDIGTTPHNPNEEESPKELSAALVQRVNVLSVDQMLKVYAEYLFEHNCFQSKDELKSHIGTLVSSAMDAGDSSAGSLEKLVSYVDNKIKYVTAQDKIEKGMDTMTSNIVETFIYDTEIFKSLSPEEAKVLERANELVESYYTEMYKVRELIGDLPSIAVREFVKKYEQLFVPGFVTLYCKK